MPRRRTLATNDRRLQEASEALKRAASAMRYGLIAVGVGVTFQQVAPMLSDAQFTWGERRVAAMVAVVTFGGFAVAGWIAGSVAKAGAAVLGAMADATEAAVRAGDLIESQLVPAMTRAALALEGLSGQSRPSPAAEVREAIAQGRWSRAEALIGPMPRNDPDRARLAQELDDGMTRAADSCRQRLDAAIAAEDAPAAIDARDALTLHLRGAALRDLDAGVARWVAGWVRGRVRLAEFTPELAESAARGAERFGDTSDGRWLASALPDLRRRAGLCVTCARPYAGSSVSCPSCRKSGTAPPHPVGSNPRGTP